MVAWHEAGRDAKGLTCWTHFTAMLFCHLARADSLREICNGLACCLGKLVHLGIHRGRGKSNLSCANAHRTADLFKDLSWTLTHRFGPRQKFGARQYKFRFKNKPLSVDLTIIRLRLSVFPWAKFRRSKGGVKAHVLLKWLTTFPRSIGPP